jgi:hypothetical protein
MGIGPVADADARWASFIVTPPFPDYVSGHNSNTESGKRSGRSIIRTTMVMSTLMRMSGRMVMDMGMVTVMTSLRRDSSLKVMLASRTGNHRRGGEISDKSQHRQRLF